MELDYILLFLALLLFMFLIYTVIPTIIIRLVGLGVVKRLNKPNTVALTFDDGPNPIYTVQLLDLLEKYQVKATFFVVGSKVEKNKEVINRMYQEGHLIGIHHYEHKSAWFMNPFTLRKHLVATEKSIKSCTKTDVIVYRPPWGHFNLFTLLISKKYKRVMWSHIYRDWKVEACQSSLLQNLRKTDSDGSILLLHDCGETKGADEDAPKHMLQALEIYLKEGKEKGITFSTVIDW